MFVYGGSSALVRLKSLCWRVYLKVNIQSKKGAMETIRPFLGDEIHTGKVSERMLEYIFMLFIASNFLLGFLLAKPPTLQ